MKKLLYQKKQQAIQQLIWNLKSLGGSDKKMSRNDLVKELSKEISPELRNAINFLLYDPEGQKLYNEMDIAAKGGSTDGKVSEKDLNAIRGKYGV